MTPMPLRALRDMTDPLAFTGDQIVYLDTVAPGPTKRPGVRITEQRPMSIPKHVDDWLVERYAAETTPRTRVSAPRPHPVDWLGIVALVCGVVTVGTVLVLVLLAAGRR